jgi:hypothetical protein
MDSIYTGAYLTIIAAAGNCASNGLPGVRSTPRLPQPRVLVGNGLFMSSLPNPARTIASSKWMSRAWTYQEGLLSKRRLVFTEHQVYFQCSGMHCFESINLPLDYMHTKPGVHAKNSRFREGTTYARVFPLVSVARRADDYLNRVNEYVQRVMSYDCDALNAILGVLKVFEKLPLPVYHHWGIPLFSLYTKDSRKTDWTTSYAIGLTWEFGTVAERRHGLPSWSWVGWKNWTDITFPLAEFSPYRVDLNHFFGDPHSSTYKAHFQVELKIQNRFSSLVENDHPNLEALSASSPFVYITAWTIELHMRKLSNQKWEVLNQDIIHEEPVSVQIMETSSSGEYRWKAFLLGIKRSGRSSHGGASRHVPWCKPKFLLINKVKDCFERVGLCSFTIKAFPLVNGDTDWRGHFVSGGKANLGELTLRRERLKLG